MLEPVFLGWQGVVPATEFGVSWAKQEYRDAWKTAKLRASVVGFIPETRKKQELWIVEYDNGERGNMPTDQVKFFFEPVDSDEDSDEDSESAPSADEAEQDDREDSEHDE